MSADQARATRPGVGKLGTFAGVFTPSVLTILGLILFLRLGYVVGDAGLGRALLVIALANAISVLTSISLAAIATNLRVQGGGDYYLISRTLGRAFGGAIGVVLFLAQSVSIAFYAIGFGEAVASITGASDPYDVRLLAAAAVAVLFVLAWFGADWATRAQFVIMAVLALALAAFVVGAIGRSGGSQLAANFAPSGESSFWVLFALFFPAVTGFTQGVSMSGDLREPGRSIPAGTFLAVGVSLVVYLGAAVLFAAALPGRELVADYGAMRRVAALPWLIDAAVIAATVSSALASFLGAPRILQSLAADRVFPLLGPFAHGVGPSGNPRRGVLLAAGIALGVVAIGSLDLIAPVVTMFFLISYGLLNYATFVEARSNSPSFRPRFRWFDQRLSLLGCAVCLVAIVAIDPLAGGIAFAFLLAIHAYLQRSDRVERWADSSRSAHLQRVRRALLAMSAELEHPRDWRPVILAFSDEPERRERLLRFASWIEGRSGLTTVVHVVEGHGPRTQALVRERAAQLRADIKARGLDALTLAVAMRDSESGFPLLVESFGIGPLRANTVLLNWYGRDAELDAEGFADYGRYLRAAVRSGRNVVLLDALPADFARIERTEPPQRRIDIWWPRDDDHTRLALLLAYLMTRTEPWHDAELRVLTPAARGAEEVARFAELERRLADFRIPATLFGAEDMDVATLARHSADATLVFLPFRVPPEGPVACDGGPLEPILERLPIVALVLSGQDIVLDTPPEGGQHGVITAAADAAMLAARAASAAQAELVDAERAAAKTRRQLEEARTAGDDQTAVELAAYLARADDEVEARRRRALKRQAIADTAQRAADAVAGNGEEKAAAEADEAQA